MLKIEKVYKNVIVFYQIEIIYIVPDGNKRKKKKKVN